MKNQTDNAVPPVPLARLVVRLRVRGHVLNAAIWYHSLAHFWLLGWTCSASLSAAAISWAVLPFAAASVWEASERLNSAREADYDASRRREFLSHNVDVLAPSGEKTQPKSQDV